MATDIENLKEIRSKIYQRLNDITRKPDASGTDTLGHVAEKMSLWDELERLDRQIASAEGAYEVTSEMYA